ncbi:hypothetical protein Fcan01_04813 [Folsomia candida]|uniref:Uncharacterized protein n=1 Tax=Folsomia candida TaxID=158441 RepID=A0A226EUT9_FOLCA|nr:hypothetical protein Fcan01_04813 [Folsomia candida]
MKFIRFLIILIGIIQIEGNAIRNKASSEESNKVLGGSSSSSKSEFITDSKHVAKGTGSTSASEAQVSGREEELDSDADDNDDHAAMMLQQSGGSDSMHQSGGNLGESAGGSVIMQQHVGDGTLSSSTSSQDGGSETIVMQQVVIQPGQKYIVHKETREIEIVSQQPRQGDVDQAGSGVSSSLNQAGSTEGGSTAEKSGMTQGQYQSRSNNGGKVTGRSKQINKKSSRFNARHGVRSEGKDSGGVNVPNKQGPEVNMGQQPQQSKVITYQGNNYVAGYPATNEHTIIIPPGWTVVQQSRPQVATDQRQDQGQSGRESSVTYERHGGGQEGGNQVPQAQQSLVTDMQPGQKITMQRTDAIVLQETKQVVLPPGQRVELKPSEELVQVVQTGGEGTTPSSQ